MNYNYISQKYQLSMFPRVLFSMPPPNFLIECVRKFQMCFSLFGHYKILNIQIATYENANNVCTSEHFERKQSCLHIDLTMRYAK